MNEGSVQAVPEHDQVVGRVIEEATEFATARGRERLINISVSAAGG